MNMDNVVSRRSSSAQEDGPTVLYTVTGPANVKDDELLRLIEGESSLKKAT